MSRSPVRRTAVLLLLAASLVLPQLGEARDLGARAREHPKRNIIEAISNALPQAWNLVKVIWEQAGSSLDPFGEPKPNAGSSLDPFGGQ